RSLYSENLVRFATQSPSRSTTHFLPDQYITGGERRVPFRERSPMYQLMTTVSVLVDDLHSGVAALCRSIGIPKPRPQSYRSGPGIDAVFCRVHVKYPVAPTFLELVAPGSGEATDDYALFPVNQIAARQGKRAIKWHATELAMGEDTFVDLARHLERLAVPHGFIPPDPRERFFLGREPPHPAHPDAPAPLP